MKPLTILSLLLAAACTQTSAWSANLSFDKIATVKDKAKSIQLVKVSSIPGAVAYVSCMRVDADGAPNAYGPKSKPGIDNIGNAGAPGNWWALVLDKNTKQPYVQKSGPYAGYYVSMTKLEDRTKDETDPARYVNASTVPYIVLSEPARKAAKANWGDLAIVVNLHTKQSAGAIIADLSNDDELGEGSINLVNVLAGTTKVMPGTLADDVLYIVIPGSGKSKPIPETEIKAFADKTINSEKFCYQQILDHFKK